MAQNIHTNCIMPLHNTIERNKLFTAKKICVLLHKFYTSLYEFGRYYFWRCFMKDTSCPPGDLLFVRAIRAF